MVEYNELYKDVKKMLSEKRFVHSEAVVKRALEYAAIYNVDETTVKLVAIAHDIAKNLSTNEIDYYKKKYNIELDFFEKINSNLLHQKIGAYICKNMYGFSDDMVNSVRYHTTGRANMSVLEKIIYLADATEENRKYCSSSFVDIIKEDINKGMVEICKWSINHVLDTNSIIHPDSIECYNFYIMN